MPDPIEVATYRFEVIAPLLDETLSSNERRRLLRELGSRPQPGSTGEQRPVSRSTAYRWLQAYRAGGLEALQPATRCDKGQPREDRSAVVDRALDLLIERPERSLTLVLALMEAQDRTLSIARSTLQRELKRHPRFDELRQARRHHRKARRRFEAREPHDLWQLDAKGPITVAIGGRPTRVTILSILDDHSRALLAVTAAGREKLGPAVRIFRIAASQWGLPNRLYADRHAVYDSQAFRQGLAVFGLHRIRSRSKNAPARGKIERYHRLLGEWFLGELPHQTVVSWQHLEDLLQAFQEVLYNAHRHRGFRMAPAERLAGRRSPRTVSRDALREAFWVREQRKAHPVTGEVDLPGGRVCIPRLRGQAVTLRWDPAEPTRIRLVEPAGETPLEPDHAKQPRSAEPTAPPSGPGRLQPLLDRWQGRELPQAEPGFGLPEVFAALAQHLGRRVPADGHEATTIQDFYRQNGPFGAAAFHAALDAIRSRLGCGRPLSVVLAALVREAKQAGTKQGEEDQSL